MCGCAAGLPFGLAGVPRSCIAGISLSQRGSSLAGGSLVTSLLLTAGAGCGVALGTTRAKRQCTLPSASGSWASSTILKAGTVVRKPFFSASARSGAALASHFLPAGRKGSSPNFST